MIRKTIEIVTRDFDAAVRSVCLERDEKITTIPSADLVASLLRLALHFKHLRFSKEKEWRLIYSITKPEVCFTENDKLPVRTRVSQEQLIPYVAIPLCKSDERLRLESVMMGPKCNAGIEQLESDSALNQLLCELQNGKPTNGIKHSSIPYC